jgi:preprotein translocase subunit YajC
MPDISQFFLSAAWAQTTPDAASHSGSMSDFFSPQMIVFILIFFVFYILLIRPQQKKADQHNAMIKALRRGDRIVTGGGVVGAITKLEGDDFLIVEIADNVRIKVLRSTVSSLSAKTEPVTADSDNEEAKKS